MNKIRKIPPVCLGYAIVKLLVGRLRLSSKYLGTEVKNYIGDIFNIFRNIHTHKRRQNTNSCVFIVSFKFAHLSHKANKLASIIPMLLIAGFPGFIQKIYAVNQQNGYWQGMYEWESLEHLNAYKKSFVFKIMNKRAINQSIVSEKYLNKMLNEVIVLGRRIKNMTEATRN